MSIVNNSALVVSRMSRMTCLKLPTFSPSSTGIARPSSTWIVNESKRLGRHKVISEVVRVHVLPDQREI